ncbi:MAG: hydroxysqualene dehydroxylase HpnE [Chromatiales bacterium]|jgi:squalene-associated FAD-dependent desaturase
MPARVVVVGAGWAGLACAVELLDRGLEVTLLEAAREPGGRAREVRIDDQALDNGQHLLIGAYTSTLELMQRVEAPLDQLLLRRPLELRVHAGSGRRLELKAPPLPAPLHLLFALLGARGLSLTERLAALAGSRRLLGWSASRDIDVRELLRRTAQPAILSELLWEPLCLAALNIEAEHASAEVFVATLRAAFSGARAQSDLLIPRGNLSEILTRPALRHLQSRGALLRLSEPVTALQCRNRRITGVTTRRGEHAAEQVVLAVSSRAAATLLRPMTETAALAAGLDDLGEEPIATLYLRYESAPPLPLPFVGLTGSIGQWVFDRGPAGQPGLLAVVISGSGPHQALDNPTLLERVVDELAHLQPEWPGPSSGHVVREKRATFRCSVGCNSRRPVHETPIAGLWLAGDYTRTGLPPTLEGAVRSGLECARLISGHGNEGT